MTTAAGTIVGLLPGALVKVKLENGEEVTAHVVEEFRRTNVAVKPGDRVQVKRSPTDPKRGSIVGAIR